MPKYKIGDYVLAKAGDMLYKSKILRIRNVGTNRIEYFIHFDGWNKKWDCWKKERTIKPHNDESLHELEIMKKEHRNNQDSKKKKSGNKRKSSTMSATGFKLDLPLDLMEKLVHDRTEIEVKDTIYEIPVRSTSCVVHILKLFSDQIDARYANESCSDDEANENRLFVEGLIDLFDVLLPLKLLYPSERTQYESLADQKPSTTYGYIHLLRMLTKMPELLSDTAITKELHASFQSLSRELFTFLSKNEFK